jgi:iron complex transport system substrate-binding protein
MSRAFTRAVVLGLSATLLAACSTGATGSTEGGGDTPDATGGEADATDDAFPATVEHAFGETTIETDPQRVVTVGWSDADVVASLGEVPVGATAITWGGNEAGSTDWFDAAVADLGASTEDITRYDDSDGIPVDEIAALEPDVILGTNSGLTQEDYDTLSKIAPVVAYPEVAWGTPWQDSVELVGQALGRGQEAAEVVDETQAAIDAALEDNPHIEGKSVAWAWFTPADLSTIGLYTSIDLRPQMLREFGMVDAEVVTELSEGTDAFTANLSAEQADTLDADVLIFYVDDQTQEETLLADPLIGQIPALQDGSYVASSDNVMALPLSSPTPLSIPVALEGFLPMVDEAAQAATR